MKDYYIDKDVIADSHLLLLNAKTLKEEKFLSDQIANFGHQVKNKPGNFYVLLALNSYDGYQEKLIQIVSKLPVGNIQFFVLNSSEAVYGKKDMLSLVQTNAAVAAKYNREISFSSRPISFVNDLEKHWPFSYVLHANEQLNAVVEEIKKQNLSPYERYLAAYLWVTNFVYKLEENKDNYYLSRSVVEILNGQYIVCVGFVNLLKATCLALDIPFVNVEQQKGKLYHSTGLVQIDDDKYHIHAIAQSNPTRDSKRSDDPERKGLLNHLLPLQFSLDGFKPNPMTELELFLNSFLKQDENLFFKNIKNEHSFLKVMQKHGFIEKNSDADPNKETTLSPTNQNLLEKFYRKAASSDAMDFNKLNDALAVVFSKCNFNFYAGGILNPNVAKLTADRVLMYNKRKLHAERLSNINFLPGALHAEFENINELKK